MREFLKKNWIGVSLFLFMILNSAWILFKGLPFQHDLTFHYSRMVSLANTIKNGDIIALIHDGFYGYGYAMGLFYGNLFFYIPAFLSILGMPKMISYKIFLILINIATILVSYFCFKKMFKEEKVSLLITILYTFSAYRFIDICVRGAIGETIAFMILPIIFLGLYHILFEDYKKWYYFSIGFVLLLSSHLITTLLVAFFCVCIIIANIKRLIKEQVRLKVLILSGIFGLLLGSFLLFPMLEQYFKSEISIFTEGSFYIPKGMTIKETLLPRWFFSYYLGLGIILLLPLRFLYKRKEVTEKYHNLLIFGDTLLVLGLISWICTTNLFPWDILGKQLSFIQFPWRLLLISTTFFVISFGVSLLILKEQKKDKMIKVVTIIIIGTSLFTSGIYAVQYGIRKHHFHTIKDNEIGNAEYLPSKTDHNIETKGTFISNNSELIYQYQKKGTTVTIQYENNLKEGTYIEIPLFYYLGYEVEPDYQMIKGKNNVIRVYLKEKEGNFQVSYQGTMIQKVSYGISFVTLITFITWLISKKKIKAKK